MPLVPTKENKIQTELGQTKVQPHISHNLQEEEAYPVAKTTPEVEVATMVAAQENQTEADLKAETDPNLTTDLNLEPEIAIDVVKPTTSSKTATLRTNPVSIVTELVIFQLFAKLPRETTVKAAKAKHLDLPTQLKVF